MKADELKKRRRELGLTQLELSALLKVDPMTISRWERGLYEVPEAVALALLAMKGKGKGK